MDNLLLDIIRGENGSYYFSDFPEALVYALIGFAIVFVGIAIIITIIWLVGLLMRKTDNLAFLSEIGKKKPKSDDVSSEAPPVSEEEALPDELKAAIIAAIMMYYESERPQCEFIVKRIKRI